jgi:NitT/TauT family transport system permease protein
MSGQFGTISSERPVASSAVKSRAVDRHAAPGWLERNRATLILVLLRLLLALLLLSIWQIAVSLHWIGGVFIAGPIDSAVALKQMALDGSLWYHTSETLKAASIGFCLGMVVGLAAGFTIGLIPAISNVVSPFITVLNSMPRIALAPLFVIWFGIGTTSGVALVFSLVVFIALTNVIAGTQAVDRNHMLIAKLYGASQFQLILDIVLPSALPWIIAASRLSLAYSLSGAIVSEMFLGQRGLGYLIVAGSGYYNIPQVFAAFLMTLAIAGVLELCAQGLERRFLRWRPLMWA